MKNPAGRTDEVVFTGPPTTLDGWEKALVEYFLVIGGDGDSSDLHAFEVSASTLAIACGLDTQDVEVERAFHAVLVNDPFLEHALQFGSSLRQTQELPGFFVYLVLTLFIDGLLDEHKSIGGAFRRKLASWLGVDRSFNDLQGVAAMWKALEIWLDKRVNAGAPFRRLVLPDPGVWHQIGHTRRLSFPTRRDYKTVENFLSSNGIDGPARILLAFQPLLNNVSVGLKDAFEDFRRSYYLRRRALADHRFWRLITRVKHLASHASTNRQAVLEMTFDDHGEPEFRGSNQVGFEMQSHVSLSSALAAMGGVSSSNLGTAISRGYLFFRQVGMGRWQAEVDLARCNERVFVALTSKIQAVMGTRLGLLFGDSTWKTTKEPKLISSVQTAFAQARLLIDASDSIFRPTVSSGVRVYGRWLGLPRFLPLIETDSSRITIVAKVDDSVTIERFDFGNNVQLVSDEPLTGTYTVQPELNHNESSVPWRLQLQFIPHALPHAILNGARQRLLQLRDWDGEAVLPAIFAPIESLASQNTDPAMAWLLEAIYADGCPGWDEADLISLVRRCAVDFEEDPWTMLHLLQDAGIITPRLRQGWKGRVWTLVPPRIVLAYYGDQKIALLEGALCGKLIEDFNLAVAGLGGKSFKRQDCPQWSVPVVGATNVSPAVLAERLGWTYSMAIAFPGKEALTLARTERKAEHYRTSSIWCWSAKRFVLSSATECSVRLSRLSHRTGADHDVFRVEHMGRSFHYLSRCAAIIHAHALAKVALFRFNRNRIERIAQDGALPDTIASTLRRRRLGAAGMHHGIYSYPSTESDARWILSLLPHCVEGIVTEEFDSPSAAISTIRRSGGRLRPSWEDGQLGTQMHKLRRDSKW